MTDQLEGRIYPHSEEDGLAAMLDWMMCNPAKVRDMSVKQLCLLVLGHRERYRSELVSTLRQVL